MKIMHFRSFLFVISHQFLQNLQLLVWFVKMSSGRGMQKLLVVACGRTLTLRSLGIIEKGCLGYPTRGTNPSRRELDRHQVSFFMKKCIDSQKLQSSFKASMNRVFVRPTHGIVPTVQSFIGEGLLPPFKDRHSSNQCLVKGERVGWKTCTQYCTQTNDDAFCTLNPKP